MCQNRSTVRLTINGRVVRLDSCMKQVISILNRNGIETVACCCGHGKYHQTILIRDSNNSIVELFTGITIPRKRNFYVKDGEGLYYIPEVIS